MPNDTPNRLRAWWDSFACWKHKPLTIALLLTHLIFAGVLCARAAGWLAPLELAAYDALLGQQASRQPVDSRIMLIWQTDEDQRRWGYPLPDSVLLKVFNAILQHHPQVVGLDIYRDLPVPPENNPAYLELERLLREDTRIVGIEKFGDNQGVRVDPPPALKGSGRVGFNDLMDDGNMIRRGFFFLSNAQGYSEYFGLLVARQYLKARGLHLRNREDGSLVLGDAPLPPPLLPDFGGYAHASPGGYQFLSLYPGAPQEFPGVTITQILQGEFDPAWFTGKIVLIGSSAEATPDFFYTPPSRWEVRPRIPGVAVHAYNISQLLRLALDELPYPYLRAWPEIYEQLWVWLWSVLGALGCVWGRRFWRFLLMTAGGLGVLAAMIIWAFQQGWWIPAAAPALGWSLALAAVITYLSYHERSDRALLMQLFSKHVSQDVAEVIWQSRDQYMRKGRLLPQRLIASVMFTDLQNFTTVAENMEPQALMAWLNEYMSTMVRIVQAHHGQVNKFIGDAVMALFGVPIPRQSEEEISRDAANAVDCALAMRRELERLRAHWAGEGMPLIRMRIGIFTGPLLAGSLGGEERQEYTVIGDTVNTASRLESFDKSIDAEQMCRILIGQPTLNYLDDLFITEEVGAVHLKGKAAPVTIHRVLGRR